MQFFVLTVLIKEIEDALSAGGDGLSTGMKVAIGVIVAVAAASAAVAALVSVGA